MKFKVEIRKSALKTLKRLDPHTVDKIGKAIDKLAIDPRPFGYKKLVDEDGLYRIRVGNYRVIYEIHDQIILVAVLRIARRNENTY